jgi:hypothetical protein
VKPVEPLVIEVSPGWDRTLRFVDFDAGGEHPQRILDVQWGPGDVQDPLARLRIEAGLVESTVRGRVGLASPAGGWLAWAEPDGHVVRVKGHVAAAGAGPSPGPPLDVGLLADVAEALVPRAGPGFDLPDPPGGFEAVAAWPGVITPGTQRTAVYERPIDKAELYVTVLDTGGMPPGAGLDTADARRVDIRGRPAVVSPPPAAAPNENAQPIIDQVIKWVEPGGELVTVGGRGVDATELLAMAENLVEVDADTWFGLEPGGATGSSGAGTVAAPPPPATTPRATTPPLPTPVGGTPADVVRITGSFDGTEHYGFTAGACPDLDHVLEATYTLTDGTVWQFRSDYCGDLDGDLWSGWGDVTFTVPGGDVITGTVDVGWLVVPSSGGSSLIAVTGGTGRYDGATGACELDDHIVQVEIGVQQHSGTFVCLLAP